MMNQIVQEADFRYVEAGEGQPIIILHGLMGVSGKFKSVKPIESAVYKPQEMYFSPWAFIWPVNNQGSRENSEIFNTLIPKILTLNFRLIYWQNFNDRWLALL